MSAEHVEHESAPGFGLSQRQGLFWLDEQLFPEARYNNLVLTIELRGRLDVDRFSRAWADTVRDCDALRLVIDPEHALQRYAAAEPPSLPVISIGPEGLTAWIEEHAAMPLVRGGLPWSAALLRSGTDHHVFVLCLFHGITDGISANFLVEELSERYIGGTPVPSLPFREYLRAEAEYQASALAERDRAYWTTVLDGGAAPLRLYGIVRRDRSTAVERAWLDAPGLSTRLEQLAQREPFATVTADLSRVLVLVTGFASYLYHVTGSREILLGVPIANRSSRFARTRGLLMQPLFLKLEIEQSDTFQSLARRVRREVHVALLHSRACNSNHGLEFATLNLLPAPPQRFADLQARVRFEPASLLRSAGAGVGDLRDTVALWVERDDHAGMRIGLELHRATFDEQTRRRARMHLARMLEALVADPSAALDDVELLDEEERSALCAAARGPEPTGAAPDVVDAITARARAAPDRMAVEASDATLSYGELERFSSRLALRLRSMGVVAGSRVGVAVPRGANELVSLLAVLKAGGAYVPLDPSHPFERIRVILEDAAPEVLIAPTGSKLAAAMPAATRLLGLDDLQGATKGFGDEPLPAPSNPDQVAYVLFTSGSTGRPKGVEVPRGAFANFLRSMQRTPGMKEGERLLAVTTTTFDIAGLELFLPLTVGGTVTIADKETAADPRRLREALRRVRVAVMQATPATWRLLIEAGWKGGAGLKVLCGGEALPGDLAEQLLARCGELWNMYGPTETTVWSTLDRLTRPDRITIGRPIDWTQVYVVDSRCRPVPAGVVGEIVIGGRGVAAGYRGRPDLTAERFVQDPFGDGKLYRTGDLGRLLEDGRFECLGRVDHQVKVRGFRIELGEIESVLRAVDRVKDVVVTADAISAGDTRLVAYWTGEADRDALHRGAAARLPPYMVPSAYVKMEAFPLTTSGKVDRKALPRPEAGALQRRPLRLPSNDLETRVALIWAEILGLPVVGVDEDFFALGGTSMLAVEARARLEQELGKDLPLRIFFETPTVEGVLKQLAHPDREDGPIVVPLRRGKEGIPPLFCFLGVHLYLDLALALEGDRPVIGMHTTVPHRPGGAPLSIQEVARRYLQIVRGRQPRGPYHLAGLCFGGVVAYEAARQLEAVGEEVALVALFDATLPRALSIDWGRRLAAGAKEIVSHPSDFWRRTWKRPEPSPDRKASRSEAAELQDVEVPIDGPEVVSLLRQYQQTMGCLRTHLVVFRSVLRDFGLGVSAVPDLGWSGSAERVTVHEVAADHLGMVRPPSVRILVDALNAALREPAPARVRTPAHRPAPPSGR